MPVFELTLVRSKILVPSPAGLLHRPRVYEALKRGLECKLTLASAPAGYGKTSALVDFARHSPAPVCWYTADERDRDVGTFAEYMVGAIQEQFPGFGARTRSALTTLASELFHDPASIVGEFVNEMLEIDSPFVVVVDNYDALDGAFGIRTFVHRLIEVLPSHCHLMLSSRVLADVPITRLVARRQLVGLTERDLQFAPQEVRDLLQLSGIEVSASRAEAIAASSEGWITGVLLLADLLREGAAAPLLDAGGATVEAYHYLAKEVTSRQPPDIQHFLHTSAVLREISTRLCREILQIGQPRALLAELERRNLFVTRFGQGSAATYRYHNLFRDFLHQQLRQRDPARCVALHQRAARHFEQDHDVEEAVYHYLAAETYSEATALMERVALEWFTRGRVETLLRWAEELPEEIRAQAPRLSLYQSKVLSDRYGYQQARQALAHAEVGFGTRGDMAGLASVHNQRALLSLFEGCYEDVIAEAQMALDHLGEQEIAEQAQAQRLIGRAYVGLGRLAEGVAELKSALALYREIRSPYNVVNLARDLTPALAAQGLFEEAATCLTEALAIARRLGAPTQLAGVLNNLGYLHYLLGEYQESLALYEEGLVAARQGGDVRLQAYISVGMADIYRDIAAWERAEPLYNAAWQIAQECEPGLAVYVLVAQAHMHRWREEYVQARIILEQARRLAQEKGLEFEERGPLPVAEGILLAVDDQLEDGIHLLSEAIRFLGQQRANRELAQARFLLAESHLLAGYRMEALAQLRQAMDLGDEIGTYQFAVVEGQHAEDVLRLGMAEGIPACHTISQKVQQLQNFGRAQTRREGVTAEEWAETGRLEIYALGEGRVVRDGRPISSSQWQAAMAKEMFFYIFLHGPLERDAIGAVFWPELSTKRMTDSFHTTLYRIRRAVGADAVVMEGGQYRFGDVDYWFDVAEFEALVERARLLPPHDWQTERLWRRAASLYGGDFLPEVERVWCVPRREALREMHIETLVGIGRCYEARREFEGAVGWYRQALEIDELREDIHRRIIHCYAEAGRRSEALAQYHRCRESLRRELSIEPSPETQGLYERITGEKPD